MSMNNAELGKGEWNEKQCSASARTSKQQNYNSAARIGPIEPGFHRLISTTK